MLKKILIVFLILITIFLPQSQAWATVNNSEKIVKEINISIDKSTFLINDGSPALIAKREQSIESNNNSNSIAWIASIFIAGLGQILMGDFWRGFKFTLLVYGLTILTGPIVTFVASLFFNSNTNSRSTYSLKSVGFGPVIYLFLLVYGIIGVAISAIYIWNLVDAYNMSKELNEANKVDDEELSEITENLKVAINVINSSQITEDGAVSIKAFSF